MKNVFSYKNFLIEKNELSQHGNKIGDMNIIMKQLKDYIKPDDKASGFNASISKNGNTITISHNGNYVKVKDNGKPNDFYIIDIKDSEGKRNEGDKNSAENVLAFVANVFDKSNGIDKDKDAKNGKINNKIKNK